MDLNSRMVLLCAHSLSTYREWINSNKAQATEVHLCAVLQKKGKKKEGLGDDAICKLER